MNTQVLEYLIAISEEHSLTRAAERFYLSQPSLSHHLANVERELGAKLFRKEGRALWPTEEGVIFINKARAILHAEAQARQQIEALRVQTRPRLRLCMDTAEEAWFRQKVQPSPGTAAGPYRVHPAARRAGPDRAGTGRAGPRPAACVRPAAPASVQHSNPLAGRDCSGGSCRGGRRRSARCSNGPVLSSVRSAVCLGCPGGAKPDRCRNHTAHGVHRTGPDHRVGNGCRRARLRLSPPRTHCGRSGACGISGRSRLAGNTPGLFFHAGASHLR